MRNQPAISEEEQEILERKHVLVLGCGGLGGTVMEHLVRLGVGEITAVDGDRLEASNLNRQILSTVENLGAYKTEAARIRAYSINPDLRFHSVTEFFNRHNADTLLEGVDLVVDGLDNDGDRLLLEQFCERKNVPIVHGAVSGWLVQVGVVMPGSGMLTALYGNRKSGGDSSCLSVTVGFCAAVQCAEAVKLLCGRPCDLEGKLLTADLERMVLELLDFR